MTPFLKWVGGKRWFVRRYGYIFTEQYNRYIEPFLGGGSVFFHLQPNRSILGDTNDDLITAYKAIQTDWKSLYKLLEEHQRNHNYDEDYYYMVRKSRPRELLTRAARFIYLNRTCFNGIYRVNLNGAFNVPRGSKDSVIFPSDNFHDISDLLQKTELRTSDFQEIIDEAREGDLIFVDPPYTVRHNYNGFVKYNEKLFSWEDQERLAQSLISAKEKGANFVLTNANHDSIRKLYAGFGLFEKSVSRYSSISAVSKSRSQYEEIILTSYEQGSL